MSHGNNIMIKIKNKETMLTKNFIVNEVLDNKMFLFKFIVIINIYISYKK